MARRPRPTLADFAVIGISPALIMFLIGSLVFFLIGVFYQGQFDTRLSFIMAMFVMAAVSIARISIDQGREYASLFAVPLAGVTLFAMFRFVEFSGALARLSGVLNIGLIAMIWFCADKLTWDCTVIDENQDLSGKGLLQTAGLGEETPAAATEAASDDPAELSTPVATGLWRKFVEHRRRPHAPGIWVIYFSLAALPIFGFGQLFLRDEGSRRYAFKLLVVYVGSALGLLLTTSFLGLRRYLRQRQLAMPTEMAGTWLGVGAAMIVALLLLCMLMPRRNAEYSVSDLSFLNSPIELPVSDWGVGNDGQQQEQAERKVKQDDAEQRMEGQQGEGGQTKSQQSQQGGKAEPGKKPSNQQNKRSRSNPPAKSDEPNQPNESQQSDAASQPQPNDSQQGQQPDDKRRSGAKSDGEKQDGKKSDGTKQDGEKIDREKSDREKSDREPPDGAQADQSPSRQQPSESQSPQSPSRPSESPSNASQPAKSSAAPRDRPSPPNPLGNLSPTLGGILKVLYWLIAIAVIGYLVWRNWEQVRDAVRNFIKALQDLWARLFGGRPEEADAAVSQTVEAVPDWRPFADFSDPFVSGRAEHTSTDELIGYTFAAFEAWGRELGCPRLARQTPLEFAKAAQRQGGLGQEAIRVAELYNWTAFGKTAVPASHRESLRRFWQELTASAVA